MMVDAEIEVAGSVIMGGDAEGLFEDPESLGGLSVGRHEVIRVLKSFLNSSVYISDQDLEPAEQAI